MSYPNATYPTYTYSVVAEQNAADAAAAAARSLYGMVPNEKANLAGLILFAILWAFHTGAFYYKQWWFSIAFFITCGLETAGYIGRWKSSSDPTNVDDFLVQIICLTLGPAFLMGGIYYQMAKLVTVYGKQYSLLKPMHYSLLFIICDLVSIALQAIGGGMAATSVKANEGTANGTHIMLAGVAFQVFSMSIFIVLFVTFLWQVYRAPRKDWNYVYHDLRQRTFFKLFPVGISIAVLFVYIRCIYRVVELAEGWTGFLMTHERYVLVLDGLMVLLGTLGVTLVHPGLALGRDVIPVEGLHLKRSAMTPEISDKNVSSANESSFAD